MALQVSTGRTVLLFSLHVVGLFARTPLKRGYSFRALKWRSRVFRIYHGEQKLHEGLLYQSENLICGFSLTYSSPAFRLQMRT
jgi:hypothetical protein